MAVQLINEPGIGSILYGAILVVEEVRLVTTSCPLIDRNQNWFDSNELQLILISSIMGGELIALFKLKLAFNK